MTNAEALRLHPGDRIYLRPQQNIPRPASFPASFIVARVTVSGEGLIIVTTTGLHLAPWEVERETWRRT